ncbi:uncharacterized protein [Rutidosis leptorrhynchoides]|uniref:uncharacterized protein isoform X2 n=1 Tax=Rutidosis leptorrhynchoides TaxID=125765 RepID=UPI003A9A29AE
MPEDWDEEFIPGAKITFRFAINKCEHAKQEEDLDQSLIYTPIIVMRLGNISLDLMLTDHPNLNQIRVQSVWTKKVGRFSVCSNV